MRFGEAELIFQDNNASCHRKKSAHTFLQERRISLKGNSGIFKPRPYFWHEIRMSCAAAMRVDEVVPVEVCVEFPPLALL